MPSLEQVIKFRGEMFESSMALIKQKGHDYNREQQNQGDTLFNLKVCELLGIVATAERGILVRLSDKFMRLISLMSPGVEAQVKGESVRDTVRDIHNYVDYALLLWEERQRPMAKVGGLRQGPQNTQNTQPVNPPLYAPMYLPPPSREDNDLRKQDAQVREATEKGRW